MNSWVIFFGLRVGAVSASFVLVVALHTACGGHASNPTHAESGEEDSSSVRVSSELSAQDFVEKLDLNRLFRELRFYVDDLETCQQTHRLVRKTVERGHPTGEGVEKSVAIQLLTELHRDELELARSEAKVEGILLVIARSMQLGESIYGAEFSQHFQMSTEQQFMVREAMEAVRTKIEDPWHQELIEFLDAKLLDE